MDKDVLKTCIVFGAGEYIPERFHKEEGDLCIAVDGGYAYCKRQGMEPDLIIGDLDSIAEEFREEILSIKKKWDEKVIILSPEKDDTDMMSALRMGLFKGFRFFRIYGALGGRLDHTIANIQCLAFLKNNGADASIINGEVTLRVIKNETVEFDSFMKGYLSLFSLGEKAKEVTIEGMKYPLDRYPLTNDYPIGISNEFIGKESRITVTDGMLLLITERGIQEGK